MVQSWHDVRFIHEQFRTNQIHYRSFSFGVSCIVYVISVRYHATNVPRANDMQARRTAKRRPNSFIQCAKTDPLKKQLVQGARGTLYKQGQATSDARQHEWLQLFTVSQNDTL